MGKIIYEKLVLELFKTNNPGESIHDVALRVFSDNPEVTDIIQRQKNKGLSEYGMILNEESKITNIFNGETETVTFENLKYEILMELVDALVYLLLRHKLLVNKKIMGEFYSDEKASKLLKESGKFQKLIDLILEF